MTLHTREITLTEWYATCDGCGVEYSGDWHGEPYMSRRALTDCLDEDNWDVFHATAQHLCDQCGLQFYWFLESLGVVR